MLAPAAPWARQDAVKRVLRSVTLMTLLLVAATARSAVIAVDDDGRRVTLPEPAGRIVTLAPHTTELLFEVGAGDRIVGTVEFSDYPAAARAIPRVGGYNRIDVERVVALRPDLVVGWVSGNPSPLIEQLRELGMAVFLTEPRRLADIAGLMRRLGRLVGTGETGEQVARRFESGLRTLRQRFAGRRPVRFFYQAWDRPLMTLNGEHFISDAIRLCGGVNIFESLPNLAPTVSLEAVLAADPEVIVTGGRSDRRDGWLAAWRQWPQLAAVRGDNLIRVPADLLQRPTSRVLGGVERLCERLDEARSRGVTPTR